MPTQEARERGPESDPLGGKPYSLGETYDHLA
jgi:hypothetical protein